MKGLHFSRNQRSSYFVISIRQFCRTFLPVVVSIDAQNTSFTQLTFLSLSFFLQVVLSIGLFTYTRVAGSDVTVSTDKRNFKSVNVDSHVGSLRRIDNYDHAIIVAGHSVMRLSKMRNADSEEGSWYLLAYQIGQGFPAIITSHVKEVLLILCLSSSLSLTHAH